MTSVIVFFWTLLAALPGDDGPVVSGAGVVLLSGETITGDLRAIRPDSGIAIGGREEPLPFYEIQEIRLRSKPSERRAPEIDFGDGPVVRFRDGEQLRARVLSVGADDPESATAGRDDRAVLRLDGIGELRAPLGSIRAFRLREAHPSDDLFEQDLKRPPPAQDTVYVRRAGLLRVTGTFRGLSPEHLYLERGGKVRRLRRQLVQGVILAPIASTKVEADPPAVFEIPRLGRVPGYVAGLERAEVLRLRMPGAPPTDLESLPVTSVERILFASNRVVFLSSLEPRAVEEQPVLGRPLPHRKDLSVGGGPLTLGGRVYRRGLGVHSRCVLEYALDGQYRSFAAVIGIDDAVGAKGSVSFVVSADGKEIFRKAMKGKDKPAMVSLPMDDVAVLRLEVDYGADGLDIGDHADWADARVTR